MTSRASVVLIKSFIPRFILPTKPIELEATKSHGIEVSVTWTFHQNLSFFAVVFNQILSKKYRYLEDGGRPPGLQWHRPESRKGRQESAHPVLQVREAITPQMCERYGHLLFGDFRWVGG